MARSRTTGARGSASPTQAAGAPETGRHGYVRPALDGSLSWARPGTRRRRLAEQRGPSRWDLVRGAAVAGALAAATWVVTLLVVAVTEGRSAAYPLAAVTALFRGERALGLPPTVGEVTGTALVRGALWTVLLAALLGGLFAVASRALLPRHPSVLVVAGAVAALVVFLLGVVLVGQPGSRTLQREVSSYQGFRDLGLPLVGLAQVLSGAVFGAWWARVSCGQEDASA